MIPVPVDHYVILHLQYRDNRTRWAVPTRFTVAQIAEHVIDHVDSPNSPKAKRQPTTEYSVHNLIGEPVNNRRLVTTLKENDHLLIIRKEEA